MRHPIHPAIVHFPITFWILGSLGDLAGLAFDSTFIETSAWLIALGCVTALIAMLAGLFDAAMVRERNEDEVVGFTLDRHIYAVSTAWCCYLLSLLLRWESGVLEPGKMSVLLSFFGLSATCLGGWYGGELVYRFGIGRKYEH